MTAEKAQDLLFDVYHTIGKMKDPNIISVDLFYDGPRVHLYCEDENEFCDMLNGSIGLDLYHVEEDWREDLARYSIEDTNGVEVFFLKRKTAPDEATSEAAEEKNDCCGPSRDPIIGDAAPEVKEDSNETSV